MSRNSKAKRDRQRGRQHGRARARAIRNGLIVLGAVGAVAAVIILGALVGPGGRDDESRRTGSSSPGGMAPDFAVQTTSWSGAEEFVLSQQRGKPVVLYAMASWCYTCIPEAEALGKIHRELGDRVTIVIVSVDPNDNEQSLLKFKEVARGGDHLWALDTHGDFVRAFDVRSLDTTIIVDAEGRQVYRDSVPTSEGKLREELAKLLEAGGAAGAQKLPSRFHPGQRQDQLWLSPAHDSLASDPGASASPDARTVPWGAYLAPISKRS